MNITLDELQQLIINKELEHSKVQAEEVFNLKAAKVGVCPCCLQETIKESESECFSDYLCYSNVCSKEVSILGLYTRRTPKIIATDWYI